MTRYEFYGNLNTYKKKIQKEKDELKHYGTIGQKWGVRKWQNYDGTFNEAGKERYFGKKSENNADEKVGYNYNNNASNAAELAYVAYIAKKDVDLKNELRSEYSRIMKSKSGDESYSKDERMYVMNNKRKIDKIEDALNEGKNEKYEKILKKIKPEEAQKTCERFIKDLMDDRMSKKNTELDKEVEKTLEENKLGSISKPKVPKKYLNEDGTLNKKGKLRVDSKKSTSDIASSVFMALRNLNIAGAVVGGPLMFAATLTGFGVPLALGVSLGTVAVNSAAAGIDQALYKKLEKRADAYYEMLQ